MSEVNNTEMRHEKHELDVQDGNGLMLLLHLGSPKISNGANIKGRICYVSLTFLACNKGVGQDDGRAPSRRSAHKAVQAVVDHNADHEYEERNLETRVSSISCYKRHEKCTRRNAYPNQE
jgi:hypothetical protein